MTTWVAMLCVGLGSYLLRLSPLLLARRVRWPERADRALQHAGRAALVHLVVTSVLGAAATGPAAVVGLAVGMVTGVLVGLRGHGFATVMVAGTAVGLLGAVGVGLLS